jgi:hypothetical protein
MKWLLIKDGFGLRTNQSHPVLRQAGVTTGTAQVFTVILTIGLTAVSNSDTSLR